MFPALTGYSERNEESGGLRASRAMLDASRTLPMTY